MDVFLRRDAGSLAQQIYAQIRDAILDGDLATGTRLTPSRELAAELGVSRFTVTEAYGRLAAEGYVHGERGRGSVVAPAAGPTGDRRGRDRGALQVTATAERLAPFDTDPVAAAPYDLRPGRLDPALFPTAAWRRCMAATLHHPPGAYGDPAGTEQLRTTIARWIARSRGVRADPADVVVTSGTANAVDLVARVMLDPGDVVAVEEPGYPPVVTLLRAHRAEVHHVPVDDHGIVVEALPASARLVVVTPSHQYPTGATLSHERRLELLAWAADAGAAIVEDDYDTELRYTSQPLEPLQRLDREGRVIYIGTFSKSLSPALRVGFAVLPPSLVRPVLTIRQAMDWCPPQATQEGLGAFIESGQLDRHLRRTRRVYRERRELLIDGLLRRLGERARLLPSSAGLHVTVVVDGGFPVDARRAVAGRVLVGSLRRHHHTADARDGLVIGFGALPTADVEPALDALAPLLAP